MKYYAIIDNTNNENRIISSYRTNDDEPEAKIIYPKVLIELTESEYGTLNIPAEKITTAVNLALDKMKDLDEVDKINIAIALVNLEIFNDLRKAQDKPTITKSQYKNLIKNKYNNL
jgi:hypothetical protein